MVDHAGRAADAVPPKLAASRTARDSEARPSSWAQTPKRKALLAGSLSALLLLSMLAVFHSRRSPLNIKSVRSKAVFCHSLPRVRAVISLTLEWGLRIRLLIV